MKKVFTTIAVLCISMCAFAQKKIEKNYQGTYIPASVYNKIISTESYYKGFNYALDKNAYTVFGVEEDKINSNNKFHDAFVLKNEDVEGFKFEEKNGNQYINDTKTNISYIKISNDTNYRNAYDAFIIENVLMNSSSKNTKFKIIESNNLKVIVNEIKYTIVKDQYLYSDDVDLILYSKDKGKYICVSKENGKNVWYESIEGTEDLKRAKGNKFEAVNLSICGDKEFNMKITEINNF